MDNEVKKEEKRDGEAVSEEDKTKNKTVELVATPGRKSNNLQDKFDEVADVTEEKGSVVRKMNKALKRSLLIMHHKVLLYTCPFNREQLCDAMAITQRGDGIIQSYIGNCFNEVTAIHAHGSRLYATMGNQRMVCWNFVTGVQIWESKIGGKAITCNWKDLFCLNSDLGLVCVDRWTGKLLYSVEGAGTQFIIKEKSQCFTAGTKVCLIVSKTILWSHDVTKGESVTALLTTPLLIIAGLTNGSLLAWHKKTGEKQWEVEAHCMEVMGLSDTPTDIIISCSQDGFAKGWDATSGAELWTVKEKNDSLFACVEFGLNGTKPTFFVGSLGAVTAIDAESGSVAWRTDVEQDGGKASGIGNADNYITSIVVQKDNIFLGSNDRHVRSLDMMGSVVWAQEANKACVRALITVENLVLAGSQDGYLRAWDITTGVCVWEHANPGWVLSLTSDEVTGLLYSGSQDHAVRAYEPTSGRLLWEVQGKYGGDERNHHYPVTTLVVTNNRLYSADEVQVICWDTQKSSEHPTQLWRTELPEKISVASAYSSDKLPKNLFYSADKKCLVHQQFNRLVCLDAETGTIAWTYEMRGYKQLWQDGDINYIELDEINGRVFAAYRQEKFRAIDLTSGMHLFTMTTPDWKATCLTFHDDLLYCGMKSKDEKVFQVSCHECDGEMLWATKVHTNIITNIVVQSVLGIIVTTSKDGTARAMTLSGSVLRNIIIHHPASVGEVTFAGHQQLVTASVVNSGVAINEVFLGCCPILTSPGIDAAIFAKAAPKDDMKDKDAKLEGNVPKSALGTPRKMSKAGSQNSVSVAVESDDTNEVKMGTLDKILLMVDKWMNVVSTPVSFALTMLGWLQFLFISLDPLLQLEKGQQNYHSEDLPDLTDFGLGKNGMDIIFSITMTVFLLLLFMLQEKIEQWKFEGNSVGKNIVWMLLNFFCSLIVGIFFFPIIGVFLATIDVCIPHPDHPELASCSTEQTILYIIPSVFFGILIYIPLSLRVKACGGKLEHLENPGWHKGMFWYAFQDYREPAPRAQPFSQKDNAYWFCRTLSKIVLTSLSAFVVHGGPTAMFTGMFVCQLLVTLTSFALSPFFDISVNIGERAVNSAITWVYFCTLLYYYNPAFMQYDDFYVLVCAGGFSFIGFGFLILILTHPKCSCLLNCIPKKTNGLTAILANEEATKSTFDRLKTPRSVRNERAISNSRSSLGSKPTENPILE